MRNIRGEAGRGFFRFAHITARWRQAELRQIQYWSRCLRLFILYIIAKRGDAKIGGIHLGKRSHVFITRRHLQTPGR